MTITDCDEILSNFQKDFITNSLNKNTLYQYLAEIFNDLHSSTAQTLLVTHKDAILKTQDAPVEDINLYEYEEADTRVIRPLNSISKCQCLTNCEFKGSTCTVFCKIGLDTNSKIYNININARAIGLNTCQVLSFFHAFTGCNTVSSFFKHSKKSVWKSWNKYPNHYSLTS